MRVPIVVFGASLTSQRAVEGRARWQLLLVQRRKVPDVLVRKLAFAEEALSGCRRKALSDHPLKNGEFGGLVQFLTLGQ